MRLIAKLHAPITGIQARRLHRVGAKLLFCSAHAGIVGLEMEDGSLLNQFDFILGWRPSRKGQVLLHPALQAVGVSALYAKGLTGVESWISVIDSGIISSGILASLCEEYERQKVLESLSRGCIPLGFARNQQGYGQIDAHKILEVLEHGKDTG